MRCDLLREDICHGETPAGVRLRPDTFAQSARYSAPVGARANRSLRPMRESCEAALRLPRQECFQKKLSQSWNLAPAFDRRHRCGRSPHLQFATPALKPIL